MAILTFPPFRLPLGGKETFLAKRYRLGAFRKTFYAEDYKFIKDTEPEFRLYLYNFSKNAGFRVGVAVVFFLEIIFMWGEWLSGSYNSHGLTFHFHFIKEGSPSTRVVLQGALHLKTLIYNYILKRIITI